jgi:hypothetical protein
MKPRKGPKSQDIPLPRKFDSPKKRLTIDYNWRKKRRRKSVW